MNWLFQDADILKDAPQEVKDIAKANPDCGVAHKSFFENVNGVKRSEVKYYLDCPGVKRREIYSSVRTGDDAGEDPKFRFEDIEIPFPEIKFTPTSLTLRFPFSEKNYPKSQENNRIES